MHNIENIIKALENGNRYGFELFPEIKGTGINSKVNENAIVRPMVEEIKEYVEEALKQPTPAITFSMFKEYEKSGNRLVFEKAYFMRRKQLFTLVLMYILEKDEIYIPAIEEKLWEWCDLYSWELTSHFQMSVDAVKRGHSEPDRTVALFSAESAFFFAEILSAIDDKLDDFLVYRLKKEIMKRVINPYKENRFHWEDAKMNWSAVCAGSVGAAAIYLLEDNEELALILQRVLKSMEGFISGFDDDGLITEGLDYWSYGFSFYVYFAELLRERTGGAISLLQQCEKVKKIARLPQVLQFPSQHFVNFSDAGSEKWCGDYGLFSRLEKILDIQGYNYKGENYILKDHTYRWSTMTRKLFWNIDKEENSREKVLTGMYLFKDSQWVVDRRVRNGDNFICFAAKGGHNDEPHNHNDLGHFILNYNGDSIFIDLGAPEYVKQYFQENTRYDYYAASSLGHSVPLINNCPQGAGENHYSCLLKCGDDIGKTYFKLDLKEAYNCDELVRYEREFIFDYDKLELSINDLFRFKDANNQVKETFVTKARPQILKEGTVLIKTEKCETKLEFDPEIKCIIEECCYNKHSGEVATFYRILAINESLSDEGVMKFKITLNTCNQPK
jgi:hypothetical protein